MRKSGTFSSLRCSLRTILKCSFSSTSLMRPPLLLKVILSLLFSRTTNCSLPRAEAEKGPKVLLRRWFSTESGTLASASLAFWVLSRVRLSACRSTSARESWVRCWASNCSLVGELMYCQAKKSTKIRLRPIMVLRSIQYLFKQARQVCLRATDFKKQAKGTIKCFYVIISAQGFLLNRYETCDEGQ